MWNLSCWHFLLSLDPPEETRTNCWDFSPQKFRQNNKFDNQEKYFIKYSIINLITLKYNTKKEFLKKNLFTDTKNITYTLLYTSFFTISLLHYIHLHLYLPTLTCKTLKCENNLFSFFTKSVTNKSYKQNKIIFFSWNYCKNFFKKKMVSKNLEDKTCKVVISDKNKLRTHSSGKVSQLKVITKRKLKRSHVRASPTDSAKPNFGE